MKLKGKMKVKEISKKTSAKFFKELKVGDELEFVYDLNGGYHSAPYVTIYKGNDFINNSALQLAKNLENFQWEEIHET